MTRFLTVLEVLELHCKIIEQLGGASGVGDIGLLQSAVMQPRMTFAGTELYLDVLEKLQQLAFH